MSRNLLQSMQKKNVVFLFQQQSKYKKGKYSTTQLLVLIVSFCLFEPIFHWLNQYNKKCNHDKIIYINKAHSVALYLEIKLNIIHTFTIHWYVLTICMTCHVLYALFRVWYNCSGRAIFHVPLNSWQYQCFLFVHTQNNLRVWNAKVCIK